MTSSEEFFPERAVFCRNTGCIPAEKWGLRPIRFHGLQHTFALLALQNGVDIKTVSSVLGHFFKGFTLDTYAHVTNAAQKKAAQTIGNVFSMSGST